MGLCSSGCEELFASWDCPSEDTCADMRSIAEGTDSDDGEDGEDSDFDPIPFVMQETDNDCPNEPASPTGDQMDMLCYLGMSAD